LAGGHGSAFRYEVGLRSDPGEIAESLLVYEWSEQESALVALGRHH